MIVCLNKGIIPTDLDVREELQKMSLEEARVTKRKYRKLLRKSLKSLQHVKFAKSRKHLAAKDVKSRIHREALTLARGIPTIPEQ
jgi:hypothetical protein